MMGTLVGRTVTGQTNVYGILGDPVKHSLSPVMQNAAFSALDMDAIYLPFHVTPQGLPHAVDGLRALNVRGVNVTIPHKEAVCSLIDVVDDAAYLIGAVNTIVNRGGQLVGYNTDGIGFIRSLKTDLGFEPSEQKRVIVLGAGGAARAAVVALAKQGVAHIDIVNRNVHRAQELVDRYAPHFDQVSFASAPLCGQKITSLFGDCDLIINSTSIGLSGESFNVLPWKSLKKGSVVYDMVYTPHGTPLVRDALAAGFVACNGLGMLAAQGEEAFELWTGRTSGMMAKTLQEYLSC